MSKAPARGPRGKIADFLVGQLCGAHALNKCSPLVSPPTRHMRNALKLTGTGSSRGPRLRGMGAQMFNSDVPVRVEHFYPVPVCFGVIRELMQHPLGGCGVPKREIGCTSLTWEYCSPSFPAGFPPPLGKSSVPYHGSIVTPLPAGFVVLGNARSKFSRTQAGFTDEVP